MDPERGDNTPAGEAVRLNRLGEDRFNRGGCREGEEGCNKSKPFHWSLYVSEDSLLGKFWRMHKDLSQLTLISIKFQ